MKKQKRKYEPLLRSYKTLWENNDRNKKRLLDIKKRLKPINRMLAHIE